MPDRDAILRRFEERLDQALAAEPPPPGIPEEILGGEDTAAPAGDLYAVEAALTALTQEVKLQGRSFKQLGEAIAPVAEAAPDLRDLLAEAHREAAESARGEVLDGLLDLRDRLARGADSARQAAAAFHHGFWLPRLLRHAREAVAALQEGYDLTAARLDGMLADFEVREIECLGQVFDPGRMQAVAIEEAAGRPDGTVVAVYRRGYECDGAVYRVAQVKVAKASAAQEEQR